MIDLVFEQVGFVNALSSFEGTSGVPWFFDKLVVGERRLEKRVE
jgi:hypothetical protein